jgi:hypothetical protein
VLASEHADAVPVRYSTEQHHAAVAFRIADGSVSDAKPDCDLGG